MASGANPDCGYRREPEFREARNLTDPSLEGLGHRHFQVTMVRAAIDSLMPRERRLVRMRYGLDGPAQTLEEIGNAEGITRERVRQILKRAENRLRTLLRQQVRLATGRICPTLATADYCRMNRVG